MEKTAIGKTAVKDSPSGRFTQKVLTEYQVATGKGQVAPEIMRRVQNYFIKIDMILNDAETKRLSQHESKRDNLAFTWQNVNLDKLSLDVMTLSTLGLDPLTANHINPIPFKNKRKNKYEFSFIKGYKGIEIIAKKYGLEPLKTVICELVYTKDEFKIMKRDSINEVENYVFNIRNPFDRGELMGGFIYLVFDDPTLNRVEVMTVADIEKRKPKHASAEFWGGEKDIWSNGQKVGKEQIEGWYTEMCLKTLYRKGYGMITIDGSKIDEMYQTMITSDNDTANEIALSETTEDIASEVIETKQLNEATETLEFAVTTHEVVSVEVEKEQASEPPVMEFPTFDM